jgi:hypothetical protein
MPERIPVPLPGEAEERRQWAEVMADLHYVGSILVEEGETYLPGEVVDEVRISWQETAPDFWVVVNSLAPSPDVTPPAGAPTSPPSFPSGRLNRAKMDGKIGAGKRHLLGRLKDNVMAFIRSDPATDENQRGAIEAGERYFDAAGVALNSLHTCVHEIPYLGAAVKVAEEAILGLKHLLALRRRRHTGGAPVP